jgi:hypothetical protein
MRRFCQLSGNVLRVLTMLKRALPGQDVGITTHGNAKHGVMKRNCIVISGGGIIMPLGTSAVPQDEFWKTSMSPVQLL